MPVVGRRGGERRRGAEGPAGRRHPDQQLRRSSSRAPRWRSPTRSGGASSTPTSCAAVRLTRALPARDDRARLGPRCSTSPATRRWSTPSEMIHYGMSKTALLAVLARLRQGGRRDRRHRQQRHRRADPHGRRGGLRLRPGQPGPAVGGGAARVHAGAPAPLADPAADRAGGDRQHGDLPGLPAGLGDDRRRAPGRRRLRRRDPAPALTGQDGLRSRRPGAGTSGAATSLPSFLEHPGHVDREALGARPSACTRAPSR